MIMMNIAETNMTNIQNTKQVWNNIHNTQKEMKETTDSVIQKLDELMNGVKVVDDYQLNESKYE